MAIAPALRATGCSACRFSALRTFIGAFGGPSRLHQTALRRRPLSQPAPTHFSTFHATPRLLNNFAIEEDVKPAADQQPEDAEPDAPADTNASDVPWFLEVEPPRHPTLLHEPPPLPDIPEGSPALMEPMLKFVSEDLGLDDLSLLDLREVDPPPALGPSLFMLFGTARSERHLHVSADRLVRWLRGRGITADADGLLGRNELKTRLRRKARKAKLMGSASVESGGSDGISTGWICVNLGTIGSSHEETEVVDDFGKVTGFGVADTGDTVIVQVMTESRRKELDLERLWNGMLKRTGKAGLLQELGEEEEEPDRRRTTMG
ncbi:hypothetical protein QBC39DRAFT_337377 [Podospora conica]|nr:hypothetical protein QBC39DRAFT_337377 [Schizothecium conicum]